MGYLRRVAHVIGLTGGIASGKSAVAQQLAARGAAIVDADLIARQVVEPGQPALAELVARFGVAILAPDGTLDRKRLGAIVFADSRARADLQRITHPRIAAASATAIARYARAGAQVVFYEAALLVENRTHLGFAGLLVVAASPAVQRARIVARDGLTGAEADARIAAQAPLADKLAAATWVVQNDGDREHLHAQVDTVIAAIEARFGAIGIEPESRATAAMGTPAPVRRGGDDGVAFVTGFPALLTRRVIAELAARDPARRIVVLTPASAAAEASAFTATLPARVEVLVGDVCDMDLGLSSAEYRALARDTTWIHHLAGMSGREPDPRVARRVSLGGTETILELARDARRLERLVYWSTALVSGNRSGVVYEEDLESGQRFHSAHERARYDAECRVRAAGRHLPITILRPGIVVGDSTTGEIDSLDGPYHLISLIATNRFDVAIPLVGRGEAPLHLVPIDYVVAAAALAVQSQGAAGKTFHLVDPHPLPARRVFELVAEHAGTEPPRGHLPGPLVRAVLRAPALISRFLPLPRLPHAIADIFDHVVHYDTTNTARALSASPLTCPAVADYLPALVRHVLAVKRPARPIAGAEEAGDPRA